MPPAQRVRPSPYDKFTDASATAVASGFSAAMALGPQPKLKQGKEEGADWLRTLQKESGLNQGGFPPQGSVTSTAHGMGGDDEDLSEDDEGDSEVRRIESPYAVQGVDKQVSRTSPLHWAGKARAERAKQRRKAARPSTTTTPRQHNVKHRIEWHRESFAKESSSTFEHSKQESSYFRQTTTHKSSD